VIVKRTLGITMSEARITEQLRLRLDEAEFVYQHLPKTLERARRSSTGEQWRIFFRDQASALRIQREALRATSEWWGMRTRPCFDADVERQLNEARHAVTDRRAKPAMEKTVRAALDALRQRIMVDLEEAVQLALNIREHDLAHRLRTLLNDERSQQLVPHAIPSS